MESTVAQWLEHLTRLDWRVVGSNPIWDSDFFLSLCFSLHLISCCCFVFNILTLEVGWLYLDMF